MLTTLHARAATGRDQHNDAMDRFLLQRKNNHPIPVKTVFAVRHGQSTHNARAFQHQGAEINDARYMDAALTTQGEMQAEALRPRVHHLAPELIVTSPMTRAIQTALLATEGIRPHTPVVVTPLCRERMVYSCDIGSTVATLSHRFPQLDFSDVHPPDSWWWSSPGSNLSRDDSLLQLSRQQTGGNTCCEPFPQLHSRVNAFKRWILERPETRIMFFAHGIFLKHFVSEGPFFRNAELRQVKL